MNLMKNSVVVTEGRKQFWFFFSDSSEHTKAWRSVPQCVCAVGNQVSTVLRALSRASGRARGCCHGLPSGGTCISAFSLLLTSFASFSKFASGGLCCTEDRSCFALLLCSKSPVGGLCCHTTKPWPLFWHWREQDEESQGRGTAEKTQGCPRSWRWAF